MSKQPAPKKKGNEQQQQQQQDPANFNNVQQQVQNTGIDNNQARTQYNQSPQIVEPKPEQKIADPFEKLDNTLPPPEENDEVPEDKDMLVEYLKNKLNRSEMTMTTILVAIQLEKEKREKLVRELLEKQSEIEQANGYENNFLQEKVQTKVTTALTRALEDRVLAENDAAELEKRIEEIDKEIAELDENIVNIHKEKCQREFDADEAQYRINEQESITDDLKEVIGKLTVKNAEKGQNIAELNAEIDDMRSVAEALVEQAKLLHQGRRQCESVKVIKGQSLRKVVTPPEDRFGKAKGGRGSEDTFITDGAQRRHSKTVKPNVAPRHDDFWYAEPGNINTTNKGGLESKRGVFNEPYPWQPKVQNSEDLNDRNKNFNKTPDVGPEYSSLRLPTLAASAKPEYLYKNQEYIDELGNKSKTQPKPLNQPRKKVL